MDPHLPPIAHNLVPLSFLLYRLISRSYEELTVVLDTLDQPQARLELAQWALQTRQWVLKVIVLLKWIDSPAGADATIRAKQIITLCDEKANTLTALHTTLLQTAQLFKAARQPLFDVQGAVRLLQPTPLEMQDTNFEERLHAEIKYRLSCIDVVPDMFKEWVVRDGCAIFTVFQTQVKVTWDGEGWFIMNFILNIQVLEENDQRLVEVLNETLEPRHVETMVDVPLVRLANFIQNLKARLSFENLQKQVLGLEDRIVKKGKVVKELKSGQGVVNGVNRVGNTSKDTKGLKVNGIKAEVKEVREIKAEDIRKKDLIEATPAETGKSETTPIQDIQLESFELLFWDHTLTINLWKVQDSIEEELQLKCPDKMPSDRLEYCQVRMTLDGEKVHVDDLQTYIQQVKSQDTLAKLQHLQQHLGGEVTGSTLYLSPIMSINIDPETGQYRAISSTDTTSITRQLNHDLIKAHQAILLTNKLQARRAQIKVQNLPTPYSIHIHLDEQELYIPIRKDYYLAAGHTLSLVQIQKAAVGSSGTIVKRIQAPHDDLLQWYHQCQIITRLKNYKAS